jgi:hypothetical protein
VNVLHPLVPVSRLGAPQATSSRRAFLGWLGLVALGCSREQHWIVTEPDAAPTGSTGPRLALPPRPPDAETGSAFLARTEKLPPDSFERAILEAVLAGNVPPFERELVAIDLRRAGASGAEHTARIWVTCDYLAIGSDEDFARIPMQAATAQRIAAASDTSLPTRRIVDTIHAQAASKLSPRAINIDPDAAMPRAALSAHQVAVESARADAGARLGALTSGEKKDIVLSNQLSQRPDRVAIYGWHRENGAPIQPLSTLHDKLYVDYSHGVRLVAQDARVDDRAVRLADLLRDAEASPLVSDEGPMLVVSYPL